MNINLINSFNKNQRKAYKKNQRFQEHTEELLRQESSLKEDQLNKLVNLVNASSKNLISLVPEVKQYQRKSTNHSEKEADVNSIIRIKDNNIDKIQEDSEDERLSTGKNQN